MEQQEETDTSVNLNELVTTTDISFHAFAGIFNQRTISLMGCIQGRPLSVLIDSWSTHNFIKE